MKPTVAFVLSLGHSGSTLLGHFLGAHPEVLHTGEVPSPLERKRPLRCHYCGDEPCPVWGGALQEGFVKSCYRSQKRAHQGKLGAWLNRLTGGAKPPGALFDQLFAEMPSISVVVDSSKRVPWAEYNASSESFSSRFVFLVRDVRAVVASRVRTGTMSIAQATSNSVASLERIRAFLEARPPETVTTVHYETLVTDPEGVGRELCEFLQLSFRVDMLEYYKYPNHVFGGNPAPTLQARSWQGRSTDHLKGIWAEVSRKYYEGLEPGFHADERWRSELDASALGEFEGIGGALNRELGYSS